MSNRGCAEWIDKISAEYAGRVENMSGDFREWFDRIACENVRLKNELEFLSQEASQSAEVVLMLATVAKEFDPDCYGDKTHRAKSRDDQGKQTRYSSGAFAKALQRAWANNKLQVALPNDDITASYYWVEVVSALQKRFFIFETLNDLNKFVRNAGRDSVFCNYGFYMRDLAHICLAYAILHGYSLAEEKLLLSRAAEAIEKADAENAVESGERAANKTYTDCANKAFENFFNVSEGQAYDERAFIQSIVENRKYIIKNNNGYNHWSALKTVLNTILAANESDNDADASETMKTRRFEPKLRALYEEVANLNDIDMAAVVSATANDLRAHLIKSLGLDKMARIYSSNIAKAEQGADVRLYADDAEDIIYDSLRYIYIVALMKKIVNSYDDCESFETAISVIDYINGKLTEAGFRELEDYKIVGHSAVAVESPKDFVDGVIVAAICYEERSGADPVSGFDAFTEYLLDC